jgi:hypothetical protein
VLLLAARPRPVAGLCLVLLAAVALSGCTTTVVGTPSADPAALSGPEDPAALGPDVIAPPVDSAGRELEAHRLAEATTIAQEVFPDRAGPDCGSGPLLAAVDVERFYLGNAGGVIAPILDRYGFVTAWASCAISPDALPTVTLSVELSDPVSAARAIGEIETAITGVFQPEGSLVGGAPILEAFPGDRRVLTAWTAVGRTLAVAVHAVPRGAGVDEFDRLVTGQVSLLSTFVPTPQAEVVKLAPDPHGLAALLADPPGKRQTITGPYELAAVLHFSLAPADDRAALPANGFAGSYVKASTDGVLGYIATVETYAGPDQAAAVNGLYRTQYAQLGYTPLTVPSVPEAGCIAGDHNPLGSSFLVQYCFIVRGPYLISIGIGGLSALDDTTGMAALLPAQIEALP